MSVRPETPPTPEQYENCSAVPLTERYPGKPFVVPGWRCETIADPADGRIVAVHKLDNRVGYDRPVHSGVSSLSIGVDCR